MNALTQGGVRAGADLPWAGLSAGLWPNGPSSTPAGPSSTPARPSSGPARPRVMPPGAGPALRLLREEPAQVGQFLPHCGGVLHGEADGVFHLLAESHHHAAEGLADGLFAHAELRDERREILPAQGAALLHHGLKRGIDIGEALPLVACGELRHGLPDDLGGPSFLEDALGCIAIREAFAAVAVFVGVKVEQVIKSGDRLLAFRLAPPPDVQVPPDAGGEEAAQPAALLLDAFERLRAEEGGEEIVEDILRIVVRAAAPAQVAVEWVVVGGAEFIERSRGDGAVGRLDAADERPAGGGELALVLDGAQGVLVRRYFTVGGPCRSPLPGIAAASAQRMPCGCGSAGLEAACMVLELGCSSCIACELRAPRG